MGLCLIVDLATPTVNSLLLDLTGVLFLTQLFVLMGIGVYADYGRWRFWLLICQYTYGRVRPLLSTPRSL